MKNVIKNIVFDLDGTLIDSNLASLKSLQKTIKDVENRFISIDELKIVLGLSDYDAFKILGIKKQAECYYIWKKYSEELDGEKLIFQNILSTLTKLKNTGLNLGIVTSREKSRYYNNPIIMKEINNFFDIVVTSDLTENHKPSPEPLLKWLELSNAMSQQTLYIGDTKYDCLCALAAGTGFALAAWGLHQEFETSLIFSQPNQILKYLKRSNNK